MNCCERIQLNLTAEAAADFAITGSGNRTHGGNSAKPTVREQFLAKMDAVVPWQERAALIEPCHPKARRTGSRPRAGLERMLRIHRLHLWLNLSHPALEGALYDSRAMHTFLGHAPARAGTR